MPTIHNIIRGETSVSMGHYQIVLCVLDVSEDPAKVALDDELGRKLQNIELPNMGRNKQRTNPFGYLGGCRLAFYTCQYLA